VGGRRKSNGEDKEGPEGGGEGGGGENSVRATGQLHADKTKEQQES